jgi:hypothetical protein
MAIVAASASRSVSLVASRSLAALSIRSRHFRLTVALTMNAITMRLKAKTNFRESGQSEMSIFGSGEDQSSALVIKY